MSSSFPEQMNEEAQRLANHAFGAPLLHVLGYMYDRKAEPWLGNVVGEWFARKYHNAATMVRLHNFVTADTSQSNPELLSSVCPLVRDAGSGTDPCVPGCI